MRKRSLILLLALRFAAPLLSADPEPRSETGQAPALTDRSLYLLESTWESDAGEHLKLGALRGKPQVVALFFTSCESSCPLIVRDMKRIEEALPSQTRKQVGFVLVTLDPDRDTPGALRAYRKTQELPAEGWTLLRGSADDLRELAALLGVNYQRDVRGQFAHSNLITVLNAGGEVIHQQAGIAADATQTIAALEKAVTNREPSPKREDKHGEGRRKNPAPEAAAPH